MREIHNGKDSNFPRDREVEDYKTIFYSLVTQMENTPNFEEKFYR
jgi:hypothetical protein